MSQTDNFNADPIETGRKRVSNKQGQSLIEFTLVMPILLLMMTLVGLVVASVTSGTPPGAKVRAKGRRVLRVLALERARRCAEARPPLLGFRFLWEAEHALAHNVALNFGRAAPDGL